MGTAKPKPKPKPKKKTRGQGESQSSTRRIAARVRQAEAMRLRRRNMSLEAIAKELGYAGASSVREALKAGMAGIVREPAEDLYKWQIERLDTCAAAIWDDVEAGDLKAIETMIKLMQRRARLAGLDEANKADVTAGQSAGVVLILPSNDRPDRPPE